MIKTSKTYEQKQQHITQIKHTIKKQQLETQQKYEISKNTIKQIKQIKNIKTQQTNIALMNISNNIYVNTQTNHQTMKKQTIEK